MAKQLQEPKMLKCQISRTNAISVKKMCYCLFVENIGIIRWTNANQMKRMWLNGIPSRWNFFDNFLLKSKLICILTTIPGYFWQFANSKYVWKPRTWLPKTPPENIIEYSWWKVRLREFITFFALFYIY